MLQSSENEFQRDKVKQRLLKTAAQLWGYEETEMEGLDPVVDLLLGACAVQFEKTARELQQSNTRVIQQLASMFLPEAITSPSPSHALMHIRPIEDTQIITSDEQFFTTQETVNPKNPAKPLKKNVYFSPALTTTLVKGHVQYLAHGRQLIQLNNLLQQESLMKASEKEKLPGHSLWLGISLPSSLQTIKELSFYFDWKNRTEAQSSRALLPLAQWYVQDQLVKTHAGFSQFKHSSDWQDQLSSTTSTLEQQTRKLYESSFITVHDLDVSVRRPYPEAFSKVFSQGELAKLQTPLLWVEVQLPKAIPPKALISINCAINCFPALNRRLHRSNRPYRVNKLFNIIPLLTDDYFLDMRKVTTDHDAAYHHVPFQRFRSMEPNTYAIRQEGAGRFDHRNAIELSNYLLDLIRDENTAFEALGGSRVVQDVKTIRQHISRLERQVAASTTSLDVQQYLAINAERDENIWVEFWSTLGADANRIPAGTKLQAVNKTDFQNKDLLLITTTSGGKDKPSELEKIYQFKSNLLSRDRLVTEEDIKAACYARYSDLISSVAFRKGVKLSERVNQALERTLEVEVTLAPKARLSEDERKSLQQDLQKHIGGRASTVLPLYFKVTD